MTEKLIQNAIRTPDGTIIQSFHRHDYVTHVDAMTGKEYMVDGGLDYTRRSAHGDELDLCLYNDEPHLVQRQVLRWGTYGKDGKQPFERKRIADMSTNHIKAVLEHCIVSEVYDICFKEELKRRKDLT